MYSHIGIMCRTSILLHTGFKISQIVFIIVQNTLDVTLDVGACVYTWKQMFM